MLHRVAMGAGLAVGVALVLMVFFKPRWDGGLAVTPRFALEGFFRELPRHGRWLAGFAACAALLPAWRALVWRLVMPPHARYADAYHATAMGALLHNTLPGKVGPVAAAWLLSRMEARPFAPLLSSQLLSKLLEMGALVAVGALAALVLGPEIGVGRIALAGAGSFAALAGATVLVAWAAPGAAVRLWRRLPRAGAFVAAIGEGLRNAGSPARLAVAIACALGPALTAAASYAIPLAAFGVERPLAGGALVVAVITFGQLTPGLPVGTGVYWALSSWAARRLGASAADAAALALVTHAGMVASQVVVGGISALVRRGALRDLLRRRRSLARASEDAVLRRVAP
ncbi:MAG TPA: lysylphosphatidylglycerol synthase domain-containing protein [Anaeromyxobacteraceae bacterium]|nr:lysylphosphatidylglycerol synthase domain-containing protein [Anaeromyxobacteraceae bacterium]